MMGSKTADYVLKKLFEFPVTTYGVRNLNTGKWKFGDYPLKRLDDLKPDKPGVEIASAIPLQSSYSEVYDEDLERVDAGIAFNGSAYLCGVGTLIEIGKYGQRIKRYCEFCPSYGKESGLIKKFFEDGPDLIDVSSDGERILFGRSHVDPDSMTVIYDTKALEFRAMVRSGNYFKSTYFNNVYK